MSKNRKDEWLRDVDARQRNVVFPDTVQNEARFWRNISTGTRSLSAAQWFGIVIMFVAVAGSLGVYLVTWWPDGEAPWWRKVVSGYGFQIALIAAFGLVLILGNRRARARRRDSRK